MIILLRKFPEVPTLVKLVDPPALIVFARRQVRANVCFMKKLGGVWYPIDII
jgi:hypothetical protein